MHVEINCGPPPVVTNTGSAYTTITYGSIAMYSCDTGFVYDTGMNIKYCDEDGNWVGEELACKGNLTFTPVNIFHIPICFTEMPIQFW